MAETFDGYGVNSEEVDSSQVVKCPSCGSNMVFSASKQALFCEHCGTVRSFEKNLNVQEIDIEKGFSESQSWEEDTKVFACSNCGAKMVLEKNETANDCPFCGTAHVAKTEELSGIKPNAVLPFQFDADTANLSAVKWARKKLFAPRKFKKDFNGGKLKGVYLPFFTFDSNTSSVYVGRIGKRYTRTVGSGNNRRTETYIVWQNIRGNYNFNFDDVTITAGEKFSQKQYDKAKPFTTEKTCVYEDKFLFGYMAYHYERYIKTCWGEAKGMIDRAIERAILSQYNYDVVDYLNVNTTHSNVTFKYLLMPMYMLGYGYKKKIYNIFVNGSTCTVSGKTPVSPWRVSFATFLGLALVVGIGLLVYFLL